MYLSFPRFVSLPLFPRCLVYLSFSLFISCDARKDPNERQTFREMYTFSTRILWTATVMERRLFCLSFFYLSLSFLVDVSLVLVFHTIFLHGGATPSPFVPFLSLPSPTDSPLSSTHSVSLSLSFFLPLLTRVAHVTYMRAGAHDRVNTRVGDRQQSP